MTTATATTSVRDTSRSGATPARLRRLLLLDAELCGVSGAIAVVAGPAVADLLGPDVSTTVVRLGGAALVAWALLVVALARTSGRVLRAAVGTAAAGNLAWELGTVALLALGAFSTGGAVVAVVLAGLAGVLGLMQLRALRHQGGS